MEYILWISKLKAEIYHCYTYRTLICVRKIARFTWFDHESFFFFVATFWTSKMAIITPIWSNRRWFDEKRIASKDWRNSNCQKNFDFSCHVLPRFNYIPLNESRNSSLNLIKNSTVILFYHWILEQFLFVCNMLLSFDSVLRIWCACKIRDIFADFHSIYTYIERERELVDQWIVTVWLRFSHIWFPYWI